MSFVHFFLNIGFVYNKIIEMTLYMTVKTEKFMFDGDRSDLHDLLSTLFSITSRLFTDSRIVTIETVNGPIEEEIHSSSIYFLGNEHVGIPLHQNNFVKVISFSAWLTFVYYTVYAIHNIGPSTNLPNSSDSTIIPWKDKIETVSKKYTNDLEKDFKDSEIEIRNYNSRKNTNWKWYINHSHRFSVFQFDNNSLNKLLSLIKVHDIDTLEGINRKIIKVNNNYNALDYKKNKFAEELMSAFNDTISLIVPIENRFFVIGSHMIISISDFCGDISFKNEKVLIERRHINEMRFLYSTNNFNWSEVIDDTVFENLIYELLQQEPRVLRVKKLGPTRQSDGGRDLLIEMIDYDFDITKKEYLDHLDQSLEYDVIKVICQCKGYKGTVGKGHVTDIRDTLEYYDAQGYFLAVYNQISVPLTDRLENLREKHNYFVEWWIRLDLERELRKHPDILLRYSKYINLIND